MADYRADYKMIVIGKGTWELSKTLRAADDNEARERTEEIRKTLYRQLREQNRPFPERANVESLRLIEERPIKI